MADWVEDGGAEARAGGAESGEVYTVVGTVTCPDRPGVGGLYVEIVDRNVEQDVLLAHTLTDERGRYQARFSELNGKSQPDLQARVWAGDAAGAAFLGESNVRYNATNYETLDVELPANSAALPSEYETLTGALAEQYEGQLGELEESDDRQDVTYLANKTSWDARAVALAALADQFSEHRADGEGAEGIHPAFFYALFRAGLPANPDTLYQADASTVEGIWERAIEQGVIPNTLEDEIPQAVQTFLSLSAGRVLDVRPPAGTSTLREMLHPTLDDSERQRRFAELYTRERGDLPTFWNAVQEAFGEETAKQLRLEGQLGYLTLNNGPLIRSLHEAEREPPLSSTIDLAQRGYFRAEKWSELLDGSVPDQIAGDTPEGKRANYAELLAAQVRLSFPTAVVAEGVRSEELPLTGDADVRDAVYAFLTENQGRFEIGMNPVERYIARNDLGDQVEEPVKEQIKRIQRVYQITPTDEATKVLLDNNLDSAYRIVGYDEAEFVQNFKEDLGGDDNARQTYAKSQQVHNAVLNIASSYLTARSAPALGSDSNAPIVDPAPTGLAAGDAAASDVIAYPTLEGLFGSMDYCACEHCRSILSPAAYLVDLLLFIDRPENEKENPQAVLLERRPDIQHLPLTCKNTNTPLPYIDVVNETLEYFVANNLSLANYTGHDTDDSATAEELLASPQFVNDAAYETLKTEFFPPPMPFHRPLETLRRYFDRFEVPLQGAMEVLRTDDAIERPNDVTYGWRDILMEQLKLSRAEYRLLTDRTLTLQQLYGYDLATPDADVLAGLSNVKAFARRVGVSYEDVIELLKTKFINPNSTLIPRLERLRVPFSTLKKLKDDPNFGDEFDELLPAGLDPAEYGGDIKAWVKNDANYARIMGLITLANPDNDADLCSFDKLEFRYANPDNNANSLRAFEFIRLIRFIRLWKKLGWTIEQTDKAITALYPSDQTPNDDADDATNLRRLDAGFLVLLPRLGIALRVMDRLNLKPNNDLLGFLACWSPIDTHGANSLYRKMFLSSTLLKQDPAFADDGFGNFLQDNNQKVVAHTEALRAAFNLTADEFSLIVAALGFDANTALTLDNISAIYRRGWLARELRLSVREFLLLTRFTGLDPLAPPDPPNPPVVRLLDMVEALRAAALAPAQALYLIWNQDISGQSTPDDRQITDLARILRADFTDIESQFTVAEDPSGDIARARMTLVYGSDATDFFFGLLNNALSVDVSYSHPQATLEQPIVDAAAGRIAYDDSRKRLAYSGVLGEEVRDALKAVAGVSAEFQAAVDELYDANQAAIGPFFARYPELLPLFSAYAASANPPEKKRMALLANFLPELKERRKHQQALAAASAAAGTDDSFAQAILDDATVLHALGDTTQPALHDLAALATPGLSAQFFWRDTATGDVDSAADTVPTLAYTAEGANKLPANPTAGNAISGIWSGYLEVPENGSYNIEVETDPGATVTITLGGEPVEPAPDGNVWRNQNPIALNAGTLCAVELKVERVTDTLVVRWETIGRGWEVLPARHLYSATLVDHLRSAYVRFLKASSLASGLTLTANEIAHFAAHADYEIGGQGWLNALPVSGTPDPPTSQALHKVLAALLDFARIKAALAPDDERLLSVLQDPAATLPNGDSLLLTLTRWESGSLDALLARFGKNQADLAHLDTFRLVYDAYALVMAFGISASALIKATTNEPDADTVRDLQFALRARYDEASWLNVLKPINDALRDLQRDALVAYVLQKLGEDPATSHIDTPDKLFEYFLMDVQMEPCMQTSRIRHALSSVQLFIERCLMNLEPRVAPSSIKAAQWEWMKRYRVWEANRKVFLWPENWLEPELRDDQSPFFKETMSELLQSDITEDAAATALLGYLSKLEEVAKLEPCGIHYEENDPGTADDIAHVVARTAGAQRKYYYRRREFGSWTPWEQIKLDIEDNPVIPVVWKGRLLLFWLKILKQPPIDPASQLPSSRDKPLSTLTLDNVIKGDVTNDPTRNLKVTPQAVLCWSEYYNGKWQPPKTSNVNNPTNFKRAFDIAGAGAFDRQKLVLGATVESDALRVRIFGQFGGSSFLFYNTHSLPLREEDRPALDIGAFAKAIRSMNTSNSTFSISYSSLEPEAAFTREVLRNEIRYRTVETYPISYLPDAPQQSLLQNVWEAPFFFEDSRHVFYVTTTEKIERISEFAGFGTVLPQLKQWDIPPLVVLKPDGRLEGMPDGDGLIVEGSGPSIADPFPIERFVTEDANIRAVIGTSASARYGDREIGPRGALSDR